jgi:hypothetical protein
MPRAALLIVLAGLGLACGSSDSAVGQPCPGRTCGIYDHKYFSTFYCPPNPPFPGGAMGYSWRDLDKCIQECSSAASWGCDVSGCASGCQTDHGTGQWIPCASAGGVERESGCFLSGSGVNGETVPCVCR